MHVVAIIQVNYMHVESMHTIKILQHMSISYVYTITHTECVPMFTNKASM